ncbi:uncharacterized protein TM35_000054200 [Trypanosoma theileri]|uniref:Uncharacterized protein n=1 Tax=Trypanosoma theileri TaxID=67003 RepID=A0A1X0P4F6_9TRYP|nr:uncharacterized protein TM35_000054200 [Trypanosoma theileri]ORC91824.1 hypothetical protein TM35_000054200 [Trypanosoma theileri]
MCGEETVSWKDNRPFRVQKGEGEKLKKVVEGKLLGSKVYMLQSSSTSTMPPYQQRSGDGDDNDNRRLRLDAVLLEAAQASGVVVDVDPEKIHNDVVLLQWLSPLLSPALVNSCNEGFNAEGLILDAVENVLAAYNELLVSTSVPQGGSVESHSACFQLSHISIVNLRSLSLLLSHRPLFSSPVIAALFQCVILVVKYATPEALRSEGCRVLVALLDLLACLPRGAPTDGMPSILRVSRITARNVMRRVGPYLFQQPLLAVNGKDKGGEGVAAAFPAREAAESGLIPWMERHLLPLHVVRGTSAQAELKEDRRLALSLLEFVLYEDPENREGTANSNRITLQYLADAVNSLLDEDENEGGVTGHEREQAVEFLKRANNVLYRRETSYNYQHQLQQFVFSQQSLPEAKVREFLLVKDAVYKSEFAQLQRHMEEERGTQEVLRRQLAELVSEREGIYRDLQKDLNQALSQRDDNNNMKLSNGAAFPSDDPVKAVLERVASLEKLTVALYEQQD